MFTGTLLHLIPTTPSHVLDIEREPDATPAGFVAMGHHVVAVRTDRGDLADAAMALHPSSRIDWMDDSLPDLARVAARGVTFDVVMLTAVWMHLDHRQRQLAMPRVASLLRPGGVMIMSLRYGPVPKGRRMFAVSVAETTSLAAAEGYALF